MNNKRPRPSSAAYIAELARKAAKQSPVATTPPTIIHHYVMVDIETLGIHPTSAPLLEIAAVPFGIPTPAHPVGTIHHAPFYTTVSYEDNLAHGRLPDIDTAIWWLKQPRRPILDSDTTLLTALTEFQQWTQRHTDHHTQWYCQGTNFDPCILDDIFDTLLLPRPWKYHQWNDCRTLQKHFALKKPTATHHPVEDCILQIETILRIFPGFSHPTITTHPAPPEPTLRTTPSPPPSSSRQNDATTILSETSHQ